MKKPTEDEINRLMHRTDGAYDPAKAHRYYEEHKHLKGRKKGAAQAPSGRHPHRNEAKAKQKIALQNSITNLSAKLGKLEALIKKKEAILRTDQAQKKATARKKKDTPKTAAEKSKAARESKKFRKKHHQELKTKAKQAANKSGGGHKKSAQKPSDMPIANLKALATKVKGQIAVAKQKLAAL